MACLCTQPRWADLTATEQVEFGNGCGPSFFPAWLIALLFGWFFETSCRRHDFAYARGGSKADRKKVDQGFYKAMLRDAVRLDDNGELVKAIVAILMARLFYVLVRGFGWLLFNYGPYRSLAELLPVAH